MWLFLTGSGLIAHSVLINLADQLFGAFSTTLRLNMSTSATLDLVQVVLWDSGDEFSALSSHVSVPGETSGLMLPASCTACVSWPLSEHYRGGHPRTYIAGIPASAMVDEKLFSVGYANGVTTTARSFHTTVEALAPGTGISSVEHGVISFQHAGAWRTPPIFRRIQSDAFCDRRLDTQRRRLGADLG